MKVDKSTSECADYNQKNADSIGAGLMDSWEPSDKMIQQEANEKAHAKSKEDFANYAAQFWRLVIAQLSAEDAIVYSGENQNTSLQYDSNDKANSYFSTRGSVEAYRSGGFYAYERTKYKVRVNVGNYHEHKREVHLFYKPNDIAALAKDVEFAKRIAKEITERMSYNRSKYNSNIAKADYAKRKSDVYEANKAFFNSIRNYGSFEMNDEGIITLSLEISGNLERLREIVETLKQPLTKVS